MNHARQLLAGALVDMAETNIMLGENLPVPDSNVTDESSDLEELIHLILNASASYAVVPEPLYEAA